MPVAAARARRSTRPASSSVLRRCESRLRDISGTPLQELVEAVVAAQELAHDEQGPALADELERLRDGQN